MFYVRPTSATEKNNAGPTRTHAAPTSSHSVHSSHALRYAFPTFYPTSHGYVVITSSTASTTSAMISMMDDAEVGDQAKNEELQI